MNEEKLFSQLRLHEGERARVYVDTVGKLTGGVGRNLSDKPFRPSEIALMLKNDVAEAVAELDRVTPWWRQLDDVRQNVLVDMMFNMGAPRLVQFRKFLAFAQTGKWELAATEMLDSLWAKQVKGRAQTLARQFRTGEY
jgi:GH24 family phage-related lysozyme (muramidase)